MGQVSRFVWETLFFGLGIALTGLIFEGYEVAVRGYEWKYPATSYLFGVPVELLALYFVGGCLLFVLATVTYSATKSRWMIVILCTLYGIVASIVVWLLLMGELWKWQGILLFGLAGFFKGLSLSRRCPKDGLFCVTND